jgi:uncharacterized protein YbaP (TraB family)
MMGFRRSWIIAQTVAALLLAGPLFAAEPPKALPHPPLWKVQKGATTLYLFGSLHILPKDFAWGSPEIDAALAASDRFVFEVPIDDAALEEEKQFVLENGLYLNGRSLKNALSANEFARYAMVLRRTGLPRWQYEHYRPWLASVMLGLAYLHRDDVSNLRGADETIVEYARAHGKELGYLETVRDQMTMIMHGDERTQVKTLKSMIIRLPRTRTQDRDLRETWASGDADRFSDLIDAYFKDRPEARDLLIGRRNRAWMAPIRRYIEDQGTTFITVGAAHIGGDTGVLDLLCGEGYDVERVGDAFFATAKVCSPKA